MKPSILNLISILCAVVGILILFQGMFEARGWSVFFALVLMLVSSIFDFLSHDALMRGQ